MGKDTLAGLVALLVGLVAGWRAWAWLTRGWERWVDRDGVGALVLLGWRAIVALLVVALAGLLAYGLLRAVGLFGRGLADGWGRVFPR